MHIWGKVESPACGLVTSMSISSVPILSCCSKALGEGRYHWCHDQDLKVIAIPSVAKLTIRQVKKTITSTRAGQRPTADSRTSSSCLLSTAQDLEVENARKCICHNIEARHGGALQSLKAGHPLGTHRPLGRQHPLGSPTSIVGTQSGTALPARRTSLSSSRCCVRDLKVIYFLPGEMPVALKRIAVW